MPTTTIACTHCGQTYELTPQQVPQYAGQTITCTACGKPFSVSIPAGNTYEYHDRRTVFRSNGSIETWLQVVRSSLPENDVAGARTADVRTVSLQTIECGRGRIASGPTYLFDPRDNSVVRDASVRNAFFPPPQAVSQALIRKLCSEGRAN